MYLLPFREFYRSFFAEGFGVTVAAKTCVQVLFIRAASSVEYRPALEPSRTPPPNRGAGRITVDAREKE
jgi:hypothetical protein